jgi:hypothetical protein
MYALRFVCEDGEENPGAGSEEGAGKRRVPSKSRAYLVVGTPPRIASRRERRCERLDSLLAPGPITFHCPHIFSETFENWKSPL